MSTRAEEFANELSKDIHEAAEMTVSVLSVSSGLDVKALSVNERLVLDVGIETGIGAVLAVLHRRGMIQPPTKEAK